MNLLLDKKVYSAIDKTLSHVVIHSQFGEIISIRDTKKNSIASVCCRDFKKVQLNSKLIAKFNFGDIISPLNYPEKKLICLGLDIINLPIFRYIKLSENNQLGFGKQILYSKFAK